MNKFLIYFSLADNLLAIKSKRNYDALWIYDNIWMLNVDFSSNAIFSFTETHQLDILGSMPLLQRLYSGRFNLHR